VPPEIVKSSTMRAVRPSTEPISSTTSTDSVWPPLVGDRGRRVQPVGPLAGLLGEPRVGGDDDQVLEPLRGDRVAQHRQRVEVVDGDAEEPLDLGRMEVERHHPVGAGRLDRVGAHPGPDRHPRLVLLVALGVAEVRD